MGAVIKSSAALCDSDGVWIGYATWQPEHDSRTVCPVPVIGCFQEAFKRLLWCSNVNFDASVRASVRASVTTGSKANRWNRWPKLLDYCQSSFVQLLVQLLVNYFDFFQVFRITKMKTRPSLQLYGGHSSFDQPEWPKGLIWDLHLDLPVCCVSVDSIISKPRQNHREIRGNSDRSSNRCVQRLD